LLKTIAEPVADVLHVEAVLRQRGRRAGEQAHAHVEEDDVRGRDALAVAGIDLGPSELTVRG